MAYRLIYSDFWTDPKVMEEMTSEDRYFYLFLLTNQCTTNCGIYLITKKQMAFQLGLDLKMVNNLMERFERQLKLIAYNTETRELAIKNWGRYNLSRGGKPVIDCLTSELSKIKDKSLIRYVQESINNEVIGELYEAFCGTPAVRERDVVRQEGNTNTGTSTNTSTDTERDTNTSTGTNKEGSTNEVQGAAKVNSAENTENEDSQSLSLSLVQEYEKITGHIGILNLAAVKSAVILHGYENVRKAASKALEKGKLNMAYINGILRTWAAEGYPKESEGNGKRSSGRGNITDQFAGIKPKEPRLLTDDEGKSIEDELL